MNKATNIASLSRAGPPTNRTPPLQCINRISGVLFVASASFVLEIRADNCERRRLPPAPNIPSGGRQKLQQKRPRRDAGVENASLHPLRSDHDGSPYRCCNFLSNTPVKAVPCIRWFVLHSGQPIATINLVDSKYISIILG